MTGASCAGGPYTSLPSASTTRSGTTSTGTSRIIPCVPSVVSVRRQCSTGMSPSARTQESDDREHGSRRSEEHTSELQSLMRISYAVFSLTTKRILVNPTFPRREPRRILLCRSSLSTAQITLAAHIATTLQHQVIYD